MPHIILNIHTHTVSLASLVKDGNGNFTCTVTCSAPVSVDYLNKQQTLLSALLAKPTDQTSQAQRDAATADLATIATLLA